MMAAQAISTTPYVSPATPSTSASHCVSSEDAPTSALDSLDDNRAIEEEANSQPHHIQSWIDNCHMDFGVMLTKRPPRKSSPTILAHVDQLLDELQRDGSTTFNVINTCASRSTA
jgi:hypothetical protein